MNATGGVWAKLEVNVPTVEAAMIAYSGGLDSTLCIELMRRVYRCERLELVLFDVGQGGVELDKAFHHAAQLDAPRPRVIDLRDEMYEDWLSRALMANASYRGYPIAAPIAKQLMARRLGHLASELGIEVVVEGSSGRGNDQFRLRAPVALFAPRVKVITPVRELDLTRGDELTLCDAWNVPFDETLPPGGDDVTQWCRSIGSGAIDVADELPACTWHWWRDPAHQAQAAPRELSLSFKEGHCVAVDGERMGLREIVTRLNPLAGSYGIGRVDIIEDGILGLKSRECYEAPGATVLLAAHRDLEYQCLTREELACKETLDQRWLQLVYGANAFHPLVAAIDAFVAETQRHVTGELTVMLHMGGMRVIARHATGSLYRRELRDVRANGFDQRKMDGAVIAHTLVYDALRQARGRG